MHYPLIKCPSGTDRVGPPGDHRLPNASGRPHRGRGLSGSKRRSGRSARTSKRSTPKPGTGFEPKIMRQLIKIRKMGKGKHDEQESLLDLYKRAIGMLPEAGPSAQAAE